MTVVRTEVKHHNEYVYNYTTHTYTHMYTHTHTHTHTTRHALHTPMPHPHPHLVLHEQLFDDFLCEISVVDPNIHSTAVGRSERGGLWGRGQGRGSHTQAMHSTVPLMTWTHTRGPPKGRGLRERTDNALYMTQKD